MSGGKNQLSDVIAGSRILIVDDDADMRDILTVKRIAYLRAWTER